MGCLVGFFCFVVVLLDFGIAVAEKRSAFYTGENYEKGIILGAINCGTDF
jgi:hypothetical protein